MGFDPFGVVVVPFPFTDKAGTKRRPALVVSSQQFNSGHDPIGAGHDHHRQARRLAQRRRPARRWVRFKLFTPESDLILKRVGALGREDRGAAQAVLAGTLAVG